MALETLLAICYLRYFIGNKSVYLFFHFSNTHFQSQSVPLSLFGFRIKMCVVLKHNSCISMFYIYIFDVQTKHQHMQ